MNELGVNQLFSLSKIAKKNKKYDIEKTYLEEALSHSPTNTKLINAYIRNLRKQQNIEELRKWLYILYELKPSGIILSELIKIEQSSGNYNKVVELLEESVRINPESDRLKRRLARAELKAHNNQNREENEYYINMARSIIYSEKSLEEKKNEIIDLLINQKEEIILCILLELYTSESLNSVAITLIKKYKRNKSKIENDKRTRLINKLLSLVKSKKTKKYNWDDFWKNNIIECEKEIYEKTLIK